MAIGCIECSKYLPQTVYDYSIDKFGVPLCMFHQDQIRRSKATGEAINLYLALRRSGIKAIIENSDGFKTVDIAIPECKVNIEVDGSHHYFNPRQALSDLQRTFYSFKNGYITLRIPNSLVRFNLRDAVKYIIELVDIINNKNFGTNGKY